MDILGLGFTAWGFSKSAVNVQDFMGIRVGVEVH